MARFRGARSMKARFRGARSMRARFRAWAYGLTALTVLGLAGAGGCAPWRAIEAVEVLGDIAAGPKPSRLKRITPEPRRGPIAYVVAGRRRQGEA